MTSVSAALAGTLRSLVSAVSRLRPGQVHTPESSGVKRARVLCVDDNPDLLALLQRHLKADYEVLTASDGESALAMLQAGPRFDVIISDLLMPGLYGVTFLNQARRISPETPSIILTGRDDPITRATARKSTGAEWLLFKPYEKSDLLGVVSEATQRRAATS